MLKKFPFGDSLRIQASFNQKKLPPMHSAVNTVLGLAKRKLQTLLSPAGGVACLISMPGNFVLIWRSFIPEPFDGRLANEPLIFKLMSGLLSIHSYDAKPMYKSLHYHIFFNSSLMLFIISFVGVA